MVRTLVSVRALSSGSTTVLNSGVANTSKVPAPTSSAMRKPSPVWLTALVGIRPARVSLGLYFSTSSWFWEIPPVARITLLAWKVMMESSVSATAPTTAPVSSVISEVPLVLSISSMPFSSQASTSMLIRPAPPPLASAMG